jgi:hypothetical protein
MTLIMRARPVDDLTSAASTVEQLPQPPCATVEATVQRLDMVNADGGTSGAEPGAQDLSRQPPVVDLVNVGLTVTRH